MKFFSNIEIMIYFSELIGKKVVTEDGIAIGRLNDLVFLALESPQITKLVIKDTAKKNLVIPLEFLKKINSVIIITKNYDITQPSINELFILKNLLDKQIIDFKGNKVVRVNDVAINEDRPNYYIAGVDIGLLGIARRLGLENALRDLTNIFSLKIHSTFLSWADVQPLELSRGRVLLNVPQEKLQDLHPADLADYLEKTNIKNITKIVDLLDRNLATKVIAELNPNYQINLLRRIGPDKTQKIVSLMDPDEAVDLLIQFSPKRREAILNLLPDKKKRLEIERLFKIKSTPTGQYISTEFITTHPEATVAEVLRKIKKETADLDALDYVYVINSKEQLVGVFSLHELLLHELTEPVYKFMVQNVIIAHQNTPSSNILRRLVKYHLYALPIIDNNRKIIGIIKRDDVAERFIHTIK